MKALLTLFLILTTNTMSADDILYKWTGTKNKFCMAVMPNGKTQKVDHIKCINNTLTCTPIVKDPLDSQARTFIDGVLKKIVPDILTLKTGDEVPKQIIQEKDSRTIGISLVARLKEKDKAIKESKNSYDFYRDTEIQLAFSDKNFDSIRRGCFRNQFQTNSSKGFASRSKRQRAETILIGANIDGNAKVLTDPNDKSHRIRPKYAYLVPTKPMEDVSPLSYSESYGNIYAVMKSDVKDRSTFTAQDSLKVIGQAIPLNTKADYKEIRKDKTDYWEAQIWGDVCFSDVSHFIVNCPEKINYQVDSAKIKNYNLVSDETLAKMKETGIPVYQCKKEKKGVNTIFMAGEIISAENNSTRKKDEARSNTGSSFPDK
ncbi:hypothetical protein SHI21_16325 [Bacteriovorax sp. PP10]|uniref:Uncharacterized protein n=1 Tax=Bacteriovorax antarcticus TaxID=3088717 RepID=A0ABU5VXL5_9BACT|nr:hypothetical protein [Bacteriovorax sp. PP10]MEA9357799.1 hypothetical protein [Bacteriovorax sp. PP10]